LYFAINKKPLPAFLDRDYIKKYLMIIYINCSNEFLRFSLLRGVLKGKQEKLIYKIISKMICDLVGVSKF